MKKYKILVAILLLLPIGTIFFIKSSVENIVSNNMTQKSDSFSKDNEDDKNISKEPNNPQENHKNDNGAINDDSNDNNDKPKINDNDIYTILISSPDKNMLVSIDEDNKEVNIEEIRDDSNVESDKYVKLSNEDINTLKKEAPLMIDDLKSGSLSSAYNMISDILENYDTDITISDLFKFASLYKSLI